MEQIEIHEINLSKIPIKKSVWTILRVDNEGIKSCTHDFVTITAYEKAYVNKLRPGEVTNDNYNKFNEQIEHRICIKCDRVEVLSEDIVFDHYNSIEQFKTAKLSLTGKNYV